MEKFRGIGLGMWLVLVGCVDVDMMPSDGDGDGYYEGGKAGQLVPPEFYGTDDGGPAGDCDDENAAINPGALEVCDGADNNCDGVIDVDAVNITKWYLDHDGDGYGDVAFLIEDCTAPTGYVDNAGDCDDVDATAYPGAPEVWYNGVDNDCDGFSDFDADGDGFEGNGGDDCDDLDPNVHPGAPETRGNGIDEDCNGED